MKKKIIVTLVLCAIALTSIFAFAGCQYLDYDSLKGFDVDVAKAVSEELNIEVKFMKINWDNKIIELKAGNIDVVWNGMTILDDLKSEMEISPAYMANKQVCVAKKENAAKYSTLEAIKSANVAYEGGSAAAKFVENNNFTGKKLSLDAQMDAMMDVLSGSSDVAVVDLLLANFYSTSNSSFANLTTVYELEEEYYGIGFAKGNLGTYDKILSAIVTLQENGKIKEIAKRYGLEDQLIEIDYTSQWDNLTDEEKAGWNKIKEKGYFVVGCTLYAPITYQD